MIKGRNQESEILKEIAILGQARTKYVVRFLGYSVCNEGTLMAMEYMQAGTLYHALHRGDEFQWYNRYTRPFFKLGHLLLLQAICRSRPSIIDIA